MDFIVAQAKLSQLYQLEEGLKKTNIEIELKICTHNPMVVLTRQSSSLKIKHI